MPHYLGDPAGVFGMQRLPPVDWQYQPSFTSGGTTTTLASGGTAVQRPLETKRQIPLTWQYLTPAQVDVVDGFYWRSWGNGPFVLLDTAWPNLMRFDTSLMGARRGVMVGWAATVGSFLYDSTIPAFQPPSGAGRWIGAGSSSVLGDGPLVSTAIEADPAYACPYVTDQPYTFTIYGKTVSGTAVVTARLSGRNAAMTFHADHAGTSVTLNSTAYQRMTVSVAAGAFSATSCQYVIPTLLCSTGSAPNIVLSNPQLTLTAAPVAWVSGRGCPRVVVPADSTSRPLFAGGNNQSASLTLMEI